MSRKGFYNQLATAVIIDGETATDLGEEFAYRVTKPDTQASVTVGTERGVTNFTSNVTATLDISLMPESKTNDFLAKLEYDQQRGRGKEFDVTILTSLGTTIGCGRCSIRQGAAEEGGGPAGVSMTYTLNVLEYTPDKDAF